MKLKPILCLCLALFVAGASVTGCARDKVQDEVSRTLQEREKEQQKEKEAEKAAAAEDKKYEVDELTIKDISKGKGAKVKKGDTVTVDYTGMYRDGFVFVNAAMEDGPATFTVGKGQVLEGWDQGVIGMKVGGKRELKIPPELAYGEDAPHGVVPKNETLIFELTLLKLERKK